MKSLRYSSAFEPQLPAHHLALQASDPEFLSSTLWAQVSVLLNARRHVRAYMPKDYHGVTKYIYLCPNGARCAAGLDNNQQLRKEISAPITVVPIQYNKKTHSCNHIHNAHFRQIKSPPRALLSTVRREDLLMVLVMGDCTAILLRSHHSRGTQETQFTSSPRFPPRDVTLLWDQKDPSTTQKSGLHGTFTRLSTPTTHKHVEPTCGLATHSDSPPPYCPCGEPPIHHPLSAVCAARRRHAGQLSF